MDEDSRDNARAAIAAMVGDQGLSIVTQSDVQTFPWHTLPVKFMLDTGDQHEVAWSLGDALRNAGLDRYAELCRSLQSHLIIGAYAVSRSDGLAAFHEASAASGIEPPDTELIQWGPVTGPAEAAVRDRLSSRLEQAIVAGELTPGARGWKKAAERIAAEFVLSSSADGRRPIDVVEVERLEQWSRDGRPQRKRLNKAVLPVLAKPLLSKAESPAAVRALLEAVGKGVTLTKAGYLPKAVVLELNDRFRWQDLPESTVRSEADIPDLRWLHDLLRKFKLLTKRGQLLSVSALGRRCLADDDALFRLLAVQTLAGKGWDADLARLTTGVLLVAEKPVDRQELAAAVQPAVDETWRSTDGRRADADELFRAVRDWHAYWRIFGWLQETSIGDELTPTGRAAAVTGLRAEAAGPRTN
jgi:hypothetical protein